MSSTAMDAISVSSTAMDAISVSSTAMDAISESSLAMDAVIASDDIALPTVVESQIAMDAVSTSATGMEAVAASQLAMDAVVAATEVALPTVVETETAMNEVSLSDLALDTLWASTAAWDLIKANAMAVGKFAAGRAGLSGYDYADIDAVATSETAMDAVSTSETAMDAVSTSETAMDAVSTSETAMDAVSSSTLAMDAVDDAEVARNAVTGVEMASAKFLAGRATLDPEPYTTLDGVGNDLPTDDQAAMDAVSTSNTAVDVVMSSVLARSAFISSPEVLSTLYETTDGVTWFWENHNDGQSGETIGSFPHSVSTSHGGELKLISDTPASASADSLQIDLNSDNYNSNEKYVKYTYDLSDASELRIEVKDNSNEEAVLWIDNNVQFQISPSSWQEEVIDVSSYSGETEIALGSNNNSSASWVAFNSMRLV